jgi:FkbM family methyltransferase
MFPRLQESLNTVRALDPRPLARLWNGAMLAWLAVQRRVEWGADVQCPFLVDLFGKPVRVLVGPGTDLLVFREIFVTRQYDTKIEVDPKIILDLGGNVGFSAMYFAARYPHATVHTVEPDPKNFRRLCNNVRAFDNIRPHQLAVAGKDGFMTLFTHPSRGMSSSVMPRAGFQELQVRAVTLDTFLDEQKIEHVDLLKFDVEGAEFDMFRSLKSLDRFSVLVGEVHVDLIPASWAEFLGLFGDFDVRHHDIMADRKVMTGFRSPKAARP